MTGVELPTDVYEVKPISGLISARAQVPGSKSLTNRALLCAALADGESHLQNLAPGDDSAVMLEILDAVGIGVNPGSRLTRPEEPVGSAPISAVTVTGRGGTLRPGPLHLNAGLAGTTSRFVTALCALGSGPYVVDGRAALRSRPMSPLHDALRDLGVQVRGLEVDGHLPVEIVGPIRETVSDIAVRGDLSSQYLSALMMIAPMLVEGLKIRLTTTLVSRPYVELTAAVMRAFGAERVEVGDDVVSIGPGGYRRADYVVEPDASSASYPLALVAIIGGEVQIPGLGRSVLQGDVRFVELLELMGCEVQWSQDSVALRRDPDRPLTGITVDMADISDLVPTMAVVAAVAQTPTQITGVGFIRNKESDRLGDLVTELAVLGVASTETADGIVIHPSRDSLRGGRVSTHHDHRLAMSFAVLGAATAGVEIQDPGVVSKSWPDFFDQFESWYPTQ
jgi:3-phosphoshikimate 1-carboxyvinyltransferase